MNAKLLVWAFRLAFWSALALVLYFSLATNRQSAKVDTNDRIDFTPSWIGVWAWLVVALRWALSPRTS